MLVPENLLQQDWINSLGWTLLHSLWQHALIAICCALLLTLNKQGSANSRYLTSALGVFLSALTSAITFYQYQQASSEIVIRPSQTSTLIPQFYEPNVLSMLDVISAHIGSITFVWLLGVAVCGLRMLLAYKYCQQLKKHFITATPEKWQDIFAMLATKVGITSNIELRISLIANTPCVIGYLKPVVLLPMKLLLRMDQQQIEVILLHELAHIRRQDYLLGIIQTMIKTLFFFNPFLHWISSQIDKERENACDDIAIDISQNPHLFANTLKELAEMNTKQEIAMNIIGDKLLLNRIIRIFDTRKKITTVRNSLAASLLILFASLAMAIGVNAAPDNANKTISLDVADTPVHEVMKEVNKKCSTNEILPTKNNGNVTLLLKEISCKEAIKLLKDFAAENPVQE
ncbi:MAG TPA: M56 family metallopeptidase [Cellvibrio sp.]|nr:M56 family metallopeptidase [Cellvibrio sp.]